MNRNALFGLAAIAMICGCGKKDDVVIVSPDGSTVTTSKNGTTMTVKDDQGNVATFNTDNKGGVTMDDGKGGTVDIGTSSVADKDLGVPLYPGSKEAVAGMGSKVENDKEKIVTSIRSTPDDPSKVLDFYKKDVKSASQSSAAAGSMKMISLSGVLSDGSKISIGATREGEQETQIVITVTTKK